MNTSKLNTIESLHKVGRLPTFFVRVFAKM